MGILSATFHIGGGNMVFKNCIRVYFICSLLVMLPNCSMLVKNTIVMNEKSPDGKYAAVAFIRDGGATSSYSPQVTLLLSGDKFRNKIGNVFRGEDSREIKVYWQDATTLVVIHNCKKENIMLMENQVYGINVIYRYNDQ